MRTSRRLAASVLCSVVALGAAACGSSGAKSSDATTAAASATPTPTETGLSALSAQDIIKKTQEASAKATSVKLVFDMTSSGNHMAGSVAEDKTGNCVGQVSQGDKGKFDILRSGGTVWVKPDAVFLEKSIAPGSSKLLGGKYLKAKTTDAGVKSLATFCDMGLQVLQMIGKKDDGSNDTAGVTKAGTKQVGSVKAVVLKDGTGSDGSEFAVAADGEPYLVEVVSVGTDAGTMTFSDYGVPVTVAVPKASQVIDGSKFLKG